MAARHSVSQVTYLVVFDQAASLLADEQKPLRLFSRALCRLNTLLLIHGVMFTLVDTTSSISNFSTPPLTTTAADPSLRLRDAECVMKLLPPFWAVNPPSSQVVAIDVDSAPTSSTVGRCGMRIVRLT